MIPFSDTAPQYTVVYYLPKFIYADIKKGDYVGWAEAYTSDGILIGKSYIVADEDARVKYTEPRLTLFQRIIKFLEKDRR